MTASDFEANLAYRAKMGATALTEFCREMFKDNDRLEMCKFSAFKLFRAGRRLRETQTRYFRTRDKSDLREAFALEKAFDTALETFARHYSGEISEAGNGR